MDFFSELKSKIHSKHNSNFHFDSLDGAIRIWIIGICTLIDERAALVDQSSKCTCDNFGNPATTAGCPVHGIKY